MKKVQKEKHSKVFFFSILTVIICSKTKYVQYSSLSLFLTPAEILTIKG